MDIHVLGISSKAPEWFVASLKKAIHDAARIPLFRMCGVKRGDLPDEAINVFVPGCLGLGDRLVASELVINVQEVSADPSLQFYREGWTRQAVASKICDAVGTFLHKPRVFKLVEGESVCAIVNVDEIETWDDRDEGMAYCSLLLQPFIDMG